MKKFFQICALALMAGFVASCGSDAPKNETITVDPAKPSTRGTQKVRFQGAEVTVAADDILVAQKKANAQQDAQFVAGIYNSLQAAENQAAKLDIQVTLSEDKVSDGTFVFALDAPQAENLTIELFDEEGFELAGANKMDVTSGKNYKAINVKALPDGQYVMRLRNNDGKELVQNFAIQAQN